MKDLKFAPTYDIGTELSTYRKCCYEIYQHTKLGFGQFDKPKYIGIWCANTTALAIDGQIAGFFKDEQDIIDNLEIIAVKQYGRKTIRRTP